MQAVHVIIRVYRQKRQNNTGSSIRNPKCKKKKKKKKCKIVHHRSASAFHHAWKQKIHERAEGSRRRRFMIHRAGPFLASNELNAVQSVVWNSWNVRRRKDKKKKRETERKK